MKITIKRKELEKLIKKVLKHGYYSGVANIIKEIDCSYPVNNNDMSFKCPECEMQIDYQDKFCRHCGCEISWLE